MSLLLFPISILSVAVDNISTVQFLRNGDTFVSSEQSGSQEKKRFIIIVSLPVVLGTVLLVFSVCLSAQRKKSGPNREGRQEPKIQDYINESQKEDLGLPSFGLSTMVTKATNNFSINNKLGAGGFGAVCKNHVTRVSAKTLVVLLFLYTIFSILVVSTAVDTVTTTRLLKDGDTLVSSSGIFELGFFSLSENSNTQYVGIWFKKTSDRTVVWVANREIPLTNSSGVLKVIQPGILALFNSTNDVIWSSNTSRSSSNPIAKLLDSGNLIVRDANEQENFLWQSFDYPGDTLLPGMKHGKDFVTGLDRYLTAWKSSDDPTPGDITFRWDTHGYPQAFFRKGSVDMFRTGPWDTHGYRQAFLQGNNMITFTFVFNEKELYYIFESTNSSVLSRFLLEPGGAGRHWIWTERTQRWNIYLSAQIDNCDTYKLCGAHGRCDVDGTPQCSCLNKFEPKHPEEWENSDWSDGCVRRRPLDCQTDGFIKYSNIKFPDTRTSWFNRSMSLEDCNVVCFKNCSCMAYANLDVRDGGGGCLLWFGVLLDMREIAQNGQDIYIRMASSELEQLRSRRTKGYILKVSLPVLMGMVLLGLCLISYARRRKQWSRRIGRRGFTMPQDYKEGSQEENLELPIIDLSTLAKATNNFSIENKIGEGGFGPVYKGVLEGGQEVAVKRLSKSSRQGHDEFKNEVICIAKLQHRNLVKLLGCCIYEEEKLLIYEYMPNKSLDSFLFDETRRMLLEWPKRFHIINGIARGLLYLHQDSRVRIIHRDLKAANILLDADMNAKISDFGLARSFAENESTANTLKVAGTYGYMSPEYAIDGMFSVKSDVFSFGVMVIEIVSGKRNRGFFHQEHQHNLLGHAWKLFNEGKSMELVDETLGDLYCPNEVLRSIHVGLLSVQQRLESRPSMSSVVMMLGGEGILPPPKQPGFFTERSILESEDSSSSYLQPSINQLTATVIDGR